MNNENALSNYLFASADAVHTKKSHPQDCCSLRDEIGARGTTLDSPIRRRIGLFEYGIQAECVYSSPVTGAPGTPSPGRFRRAARSLYSHRECSAPSQLSELSV